MFPKTIELPGWANAERLVEESPGWARAASKAEKTERDGMVEVLLTFGLLAVATAVGNAASPGWAIGARLRRPVSPGWAKGEEEIGSATEGETTGSAFELCSGGVRGE